jgi:hypothetical protein
LHAVSSMPAFARVSFLALSRCLRCGCRLPFLCFCALLCGMAQEKMLAFLKTVDVHVSEEERPERWYDPVLAKLKVRRVLFFLFLFFYVFFSCIGQWRLSCCSRPPTMFLKN